MLIEKRHKCPYREMPHENLAYAIYSDGEYCYSCCKGSFQSRPYNQTIVVPPVYDLILPSEYTRSVNEFSLNVLSWLYKYYVYESLIYKYNIMYCPYTFFKTRSNVQYEGESLILPIIVNDEIVAYQQRFFPNKNFYSKLTKNHIFDCGNHDTQTLVIVEDYISAIRIGEIENCLWLEGTNLTDKVINYIIKNYMHIKIWLDGDEPGQQASKKLLAKLVKKIKNLNFIYAFANREPRTVRQINTELDPKCYTDWEIREILK